MAPTGYVPPRGNKQKGRQRALKKRFKAARTAAFHAQASAPPQTTAPSPAPALASTSTTVLDPSLASQAEQQEQGLEVNAKLELPLSSDTTKTDVPASAEPDSSRLNNELESDDADNEYDNTSIETRSGLNQHTGLIENNGDGKDGVSEEAVRASHHNGYSDAEGYENANVEEHGGKVEVEENGNHTQDYVGIEACRGDRGKTE